MRTKDLVGLRKRRHRVVSLVVSVAPGVAHEPRRGNPRRNSHTLPGAPAPFPEAAATIAERDNRGERMQGQAAG